MMDGKKQEGVVLLPQDVDE
jgi:hypothetical protein